MAVMASLTTNRYRNEDKDSRWQCSVVTHLFAYQDEIGKSIIISSYFTIKLPPYTEHKKNLSMFWSNTQPETGMGGNFEYISF